MTDSRIEPTLEVARHLIAVHIPHLVNEPLELAGEGWDNLMVRVGNELAIRLPRTHTSVWCTENERQWLPIIAQRLDIAVPLPVFTGHPSEAFAAPWTLVRWVKGSPIGISSQNARSIAQQIGTALSSVHVPSPSNAPLNPYRGIPLSARLSIWEDRLVDAPPDLDIGKAQALMNLAIEAQPLDGPPLWIHGDVHPFNLLQDAAGNLTGIIDWGDISSGDPATDLAVGWMLGPDTDFVDVLDGYPPEHICRRDHGLRDRAAGWAASVALAMLTDPRSTATFYQLGRFTLGRLGLLATVWPAPNGN